MLGHYLRLKGFPSSIENNYLREKTLFFKFFLNFESFYFISWECIVRATKQLFETPATGVNPLCKLWFHHLSGCWCRSQTAIGLSHILAFCVHIHDDDVCKQQGKIPVFISTMIPAKPFPPQLHQHSLGLWPEPQSGEGTVVTALPLSTHNAHVASQTSSCLGPGAARTPDLPKFRHTWCPSALPIYSDPL